MIKRHWLILGSICLFVTMLTLAITITINATPLYSFDVDSLNIAKDLDMTKETLMKNYHVLMNYLNFPWIKELSMPDFSSSADGLLHFYDVKKLFLFNYAALIISGIGSVLFIRALVQKKAAWRLTHFFQVSILLPIAVLFIVAVNFDALFIKFHEVFFSNNAWIFDPYQDPIIQALPETFFMHCFILAFVLLELQFVIGYFLSRKQLKRKVKTI